MSHRQKTINAVNGLWNTLSRFSLKAPDFEDLDIYRKSLKNLVEISKRYQDENMHKTS